MRTTFDLSPLFRSTVGFDRLNDVLDAALRGDENLTYPPYNIEKLGEDEYAVTLAVAGFTESDIEITAQANLLIVAGRTAEPQDKERVFLHKGIGTRAFERKFSLADHVRVQDAKLEHGLLTIRMVREVPEALKPQQIAINGKKHKSIENKAA